MRTGNLLAIAAVALPDKYRDGIEFAVFNNWPPDEFMEDGELAGWNVDIAHEMEARLDVSFTYTATSFDVIIFGLVARRFDAGFSSFGCTLERLTELDFVPQRKICPLQSRAIFVVSALWREFLH